jgi:hypothetical protein
MDPSLGTVAAPRGAESMRHTSDRDFSEVTSREAALRLVAEGRLYPVLLFPDEFGGADTPENTAFVPRDTAEELDRITVEVSQIVGRRFAVTVDVVPEHRGASVVPARIRVKAGLVASANAFGWTVEIW